jgi:hypothetical protein
VDLSAAIVAIFVALIAAGFGFTGGYYGSRWQAETNLAQWRRDQLLQFSAAILAAGETIMDFTRGAAHNPTVAAPDQADYELVHAWNRIRLLGTELEIASGLYVTAILETEREALRLQRNLGGATVGTLAKRSAAVIPAQNRFTIEARLAILTVETQPNPFVRAWSHVSPRIHSMWDEAIVGIAAPRAESLGPVSDLKNGIEKPSGPGNLPPRPS